MPKNLGVAYKKTPSRGLKKPLVCGILGVTKPTKYYHTDKGAISLHTEYTTTGGSRQEPTPVDLHDGQPLGYWTQDEQGRITHKYTADELPLCDRAPSGRVRPWRTHKMESAALAELYEALALRACPEGSPAAVAAPSNLAAAINTTIGLATTPSGNQYNTETGEVIEHAADRNPLPSAAAEYLDKARRLQSCAQWAEFEQLPQGLRLHDASFCRVRLCPMCQWRRSLKLGAQVRQVVERANADHIADTGTPWRWLMVTFTVRNVPGPQLGATIDRLHKAVNNMVKCKRWQAAVRGWLRATEVTHNTARGTASYDTYHPHLHMLLCVPAGYFAGKGYIRQSEWSQLWQHYAGTEYTPIVDVRAIKPADGRALADLPADQQAAAMGKACAEVSKYAAKPADYIIASDPELSLRTVALLDRMLHRRRMTSWGGCLKDIAQALRLDDPETGDLVHIDDTPSADPAAEQLAEYVAYCWALDVRDYIPAERRKGQTTAQERADRQASRRDLMRGQQAAAAAEQQQAMDTVELYMQAAGWDAHEQARAAHELRTLPRAVIDRRVQEYLDSIQLPDGWGDTDAKT